jgi:hypothetical protein
MTSSAASHRFKKAWAAAGRSMAGVRLFYSAGTIVTSQWAANLVADLELQSPTPSKTHVNQSLRVGGSDPPFGRGVAPAHVDTFHQK